MAEKKQAGEGLGEMVSRERSEKLAAELKAMIETLPPGQLFEIVAGLYKVVRPWLKQMADSSPSQFDDWVIAFLDRLFMPN